MTTPDYRSRAKEIFDELRALVYSEEEVYLSHFARALIQVDKEAFERGLRAAPDLKAALIYDAGYGDGVNEAAEIVDRQIKSLEVNGSETGGMEEVITGRNLILDLLRPQKEE